MTNKWLVGGLLCVLTGCDDPSPTELEMSEVGQPADFFEVQVVETSKSFVVSFTNLSSNSAGEPAESAENLRYAWSFEGKGSSNERTPTDREWTKKKLGLIDVGDSATRLRKPSLFYEEPAWISSKSRSMAHRASGHGQETLKAIRFTWHFFLVRGSAGLRRSETTAKGPRLRSQHRSLCIRRWRTAKS